MICIFQVYFDSITNLVMKYASIWELVGLRPAFPFQELLIQEVEPHF